MKQVLLVLLLCYAEKKYMVGKRAPGISSLYDNDRTYKNNWTVLQYEKSRSAECISCVI